MRKTKRQNPRIGHFEAEKITPEAKDIQLPEDGETKEKPIFRRS
jgi:hypothetical protein